MEKILAISLSAMIALAIMLPPMDGASAASCTHTISDSDDFAVICNVTRNNSRRIRVRQASNHVNVQAFNINTGGNFAIAGRNIKGNGVNITSGVVNFSFSSTNSQNVSNITQN